MFYDSIFTEYGIAGLDAPGLDPGWVSAVKDYLQQNKDGQLTDKECQDKEKDLSDLFYTIHPKEDSDEVRDLKTKTKAQEDDLRTLRTDNLLKQARLDIPACKDVDSLKALKETYKDAPAALLLIENEIPILEAKLSNQQRTNFVSEGKKAIATAKTAEEVTALRDKYGKEKSLSKPLIDREKFLTDAAQRQRGEKTFTAAIERLKAHNGRNVDYNFLRSIGIEPTGEDMDFHGIKLHRRYMFLSYQIRVPDNTGG